MLQKADHMNFWTDKSLTQSTSSPHLLFIIFVVCCSVMFMWCLFMRAPCSPTRCSLFQPSAFCCSRCCLSPQQLLRLQEELKGKELELEQARDEQRYLEGEVLSLREKVGQTSWPFCQIICISICIIVLFEGKNNDYEEQCWESYFEAAVT